jgi:hypothetical protein
MYHWATLHELYTLRDLLESNRDVIQSEITGRLADAAEYVARYEQHRADTTDEA